MRCKPNLKNTFLPSLCLFPAWPYAQFSTSIPTVAQGGGQWELWSVLHVLATSPAASSLGRRVLPCQGGMEMFHGRQSSTDFSNVLHEQETSWSLKNYLFRSLSSLSCLYWLIRREEGHSNGRSSPLQRCQVYVSSQLCWFFLFCYCWRGPEQQMNRWATAHLTDKGIKKSRTWLHCSQV